MVIYCFCHAVVIMINANDLISYSESIIQVYVGAKGNVFSSLQPISVTAFMELKLT